MILEAGDNGGGPGSPPLNNPLHFNGVKVTPLLPPRVFTGDNVISSAMLSCEEDVIGGERLIGARDNGVI